MQVWAWVVIALALIGLGLLIFLLVEHASNASNTVAPSPAPIHTPAPAGDFSCQGGSSPGRSWTLQVEAPTIVKVTPPWPCSSKVLELPITGSATTTSCTPQTLQLKASIDAKLNDSIECFGRRPVQAELSYANMDCKLTRSGNAYKLNCNGGPDNAIVDSDGSMVHIRDVYWDPVAQCVEMAGLDVGDVAHSKSSYLSGAVAGEIWLCADKTSGMRSNE